MTYRFFIMTEYNFNSFLWRDQSIFQLQPDELQPTEAPMKPSEEEEFKEKSNEEKMEKEMKNNDDEEIDWNDWIYQWFFGWLC